MSFTSLIFVGYLVATVALYYAFPKRFRWAWLLVASCYFYMAFVPKYILILFAIILIDYCMAQLIEKAHGHRKKVFFVVSLVANIGILFAFKYFNFFNDNVAALAHLIGWNYSIGALRLILPLGLSFHTFQSLSYVIEVYRGKYKAERHLGVYALYVMFFPQLVAGPIERPAHLLPQLKTYHRFEWRNILVGLRIMGWGFFKKLVIADRLAVIVDYVYGNVSYVPGLSILLTIIFFAFQLYADFSGYSDIARGSAKMLGIDVMRNFEQPYFSRSVAEFWRRWHISLSTWFRDYFYFPLAYARKRATRTWLYVCLILTFLVTGLWHGAGWTFVVMGAIHGCSIVLGMAAKPFRDRVSKLVGLSRLPKVHGALQTLYTFGIVSVSWIFFRSPNIATASAFLGRLFHGWAMSLGSYMQTFFISPFAALGVNRSEVILSFGGIIFLLLVEHIQRTNVLGVLLDKKPVYVKSLLYTGLALSIVIFGVYTTKQFIYFQF